MKMNIDLKETLRLISGGILDHKTTWKNYLDQEPSWQKTALLLTGPLIIANVVLSLIFAKIVGGYYTYGYASNVFTALFTGILMSAISMALAAGVFGFFAGVFGGKRNISQALAGVSLAAIPAFAAGIVGALVPGIGFILVLVGAVLSLVFLYQIQPVALSIPDDKRAVHFVVSLICTIVLNAIVITVLGVGSAGRSVSMSELSDLYLDQPARSRSASSGMLSEIERQGELIEAASADSYDPPADGKLSEAQVQAYAKVQAKTKALHERYAEKMKRLEEDLKEKDEPSAADMARVYSGIGSAMGANNAEMEIVKTGGGNWAEHQWIASALRTAMIQQGDGSEAIEHNYALYQDYREELEEY